jgi:hypothetical protein
MEEINGLIYDNLESVNVNLLTEKGLYTDGKVNQKYLTLLSRYKMLFEKFLINKLGIGNYDKALDE